MSLVLRALILAGLLLGGVDSFMSPRRRQQLQFTTNDHGGGQPPDPTTLRTSSSSLGAFSSLHAATTAAAAAIALRGGAVEAVLDLGREGLKLQAMATYSTITALVMNASLRLYTSQKFEIDVDEKGDRPQGIKLLESFFTASTVLCVVSGMFTAVLFNILGIYSKQALGMGNDSGYVAFATATAIYRKWGFRAFLTTCLSFIASFVASVFEKTSNEDRIGQCILAASTVLLGFTVYHLQNVMELATVLIYTPEFMIQNHIA